MTSKALHFMWSFKLLRGNKMQKRPQAKGTIVKSTQKSHLGLCVNTSCFLNQNIHSEVRCHQLVKAFFFANANSNDNFSDLQWQLWCRIISRHSTFSRLGCRKVHLKILWHMFDLQQTSVPTWPNSLYSYIKARSFDY